MGGVDAETRVGLVRDGQSEYFHPLLLAAGEAIFDITMGQGLVHLEEAHLLWQTS